MGSKAATPLNKANVRKRVWIPLLKRAPLRYVLAGDDKAIELLTIAGTVSSDHGQEASSLESAFCLVAVEESGQIVLRQRPRGFE